MHLGEVLKLGQSIWMDALRRRMLASGELRSLVEDVGLRGLTSNPTIFRDAIAGSNDYDAALEDLVRRERLSAIDLYTALVVEDIRGAADVLRPVYESSCHLDGYACLDHGRVRPSLEEDMEGARRVLDALARHGVSIDAIAGELLVDGLARFAASADDLRSVLDQRRAAILGSAKAA